MHRMIIQVQMVNSWSIQSSMKTTVQGQGSGVKQQGWESQRLKGATAAATTWGGVPPWLRSQLKASSFTHGAGSEM
jgi:hypothetical protein